MAPHQVQRNVPITPPSASEASEREENLKQSAKKYSSHDIIVMIIIIRIFVSSPKMLRMDYWHTLKAVFTNRAFVVSGCLSAFLGKIFLVLYPDFKFISLNDFLRDYSR